MASTPGSLDGAECVVLDATGRRVAVCPLDDQRSVDGLSGAVTGRILGVFEDADPAWAEALPPGAHEADASVFVTLVLPNGERFEAVEVLPPDSDSGGELDSVYFPLRHPDF